MFLVTANPKQATIRRLRKHTQADLVSLAAESNASDKSRKTPQAYEVLNAATSGKPWSTLNSGISLIQVDAGAPLGNTLLSRNLLESDELCATSTSIHRLLSSIWTYNSRPQTYEMTDIELAVGHYYWLSDGSLADEWVCFFQIVPDRFLETAPSEVRRAFKDKGRNGSIVKVSFEDVLRKKAYEESGTANFEDTLPPLERVSTQAASDVVEERDLVPLLFTH